MILEILYRTQTSKSFLKPAAESSLESHRTHMPTDSQKDIFPEGKTSHLYNDREQALAFKARIHKSKFINFLRVNAYSYGG